jgi:hypothetical protein
MRITTVRRAMALGGQPEIALCGFFAAVLGAAIPTGCVPPLATGAPLPFGTSISASVWPGPFLPLESLPLYRAAHAAHSAKPYFLSRRRRVDFGFQNRPAQECLTPMRLEASTPRRLRVRLGHTQPATHPWLAPCSLRVLRGGSWNNNPNRLRSATRNRNTSTNRNNNIGFRLASTLTGRMATLTGAVSDHELRPGPAMMIKRASGLHVVGAPLSCRTHGSGQRPPHA